MSSPPRLVRGLPPQISLLVSIELLAYLFWLGLSSGEKLILCLGYLNDGVSSLFLPIGTWRLWAMEVIDFLRQFVLLDGDPDGW